MESIQNHRDLEVARVLTAPAFAKLAAPVSERIWRLDNPVSYEPLAKFIDRVIFPPLEGASLSPSVKPEPA
jgi:hypothetical protein